MKDLEWENTYLKKAVADHKTNSQAVIRLHIPKKTSYTRHLQG